MHECVIFLQQNTKVEAVFTLMLQRLFFFSLAKAAIIYFPAQTSAGVCYWKSICTFFLGSHLLAEMASFFFFFCCCLLPFLLSMKSGDSDFQRLSSFSGRAPRGPAELVLCWYSISMCVCGGGGRTFSDIFFFPCSNCMHP